MTINPPIIPSRSTPRLFGIAIAISIVAALTLSGCTVHPPGERTERDAADRAGKPFIDAPDARVLPFLPDNPTPDQLADYALIASPDLEQKYWQWHSAIEQIPQDGTQAANLVLTAGLSISHGRTALDQTTLGVGNDPMADIVLPQLSTAARRALENARAAGQRFRKAQLATREVISAWYDYALTAELIRLEQSNAQSLKITSTLVEARNRAGSAGQQDLFKSRTDAELSANDLAALQSQLPAQLAALNAILESSTDCPLLPPTSLPPATPISFTDTQVLLWLAVQNPEIAALTREIAALNQGLILARLQYLPDFSISAAADLKGITQSILGMITVPALRREAIDAAVAQAGANIRAADAMRRQTQNDLAAQAVLDLASLHDADRQLDLFAKSILPRAQQTVTLANAAYESGRVTLLDLLDNQRSLITIRRQIANLRVAREKRLADLNALIAP